MFLLESTEQVGKKTMQVNNAQAMSISKNIITVVIFTKSIHHSHLYRHFLTLCLKEKNEGPLHGQLYPILALLTAIAVGIKALNLHLGNTARKPRD